MKLPSPNYKMKTANNKKQTGRIFYLVTKREKSGNTEMVKKGAGGGGPNKNHTSPIK